MVLYIVRIILGELQGIQTKEVSKFSTRSKCFDYAVTRDIFCPASSLKLNDSGGHLSSNKIAHPYLNHRSTEGRILCVVHPTKYSLNGQLTFWKQAFLPQKLFKDPRTSITLRMTSPCQTTGAEMLTSFLLPGRRRGNLDLTDNGLFHYARPLLVALCVVCD
ncbi:hypothetical protein NPIL_622301 [Nephila pilipes]|uniref:Uncharacterized protein n=1 Tax=Nephila pilipes TaxID=299642 RepID=A0A8X6UJZ4_NEPPI|nr:hypothetical protein NPIL_622301 [Nephila pilipes]